MIGLMMSLSTMMKTGWTGTEHLPTTGVMVLTITKHTWTGMMTQTGMTMVGMTTGPGVPEVTPLALQLCPSLSNQLHPAALPRAQLVSLARLYQTKLRQTCQHFTRSAVNVTDLETGETIIHTPSRRTGSLTRPFRAGTSSLSSFVSVIAVMDSFGRPQGLPLIPETVSSPGVNTTDEYDDVLGRHHEDCISSLSLKEHWILFDSGAAANCCPLDYGVGKNPPKLRSVTGKPLNIIGRKLIRYDASGVTFSPTIMSVMFLSALYQ